MLGSVAHVPNEPLSGALIPEQLPSKLLQADGWHGLLRFGMKLRAAAAGSSAGALHELQAAEHSALPGTNPGHPSSAIARQMQRSRILLLVESSSSSSAEDQSAQWLSLETSLTNSRV